jgi:hypothetical protein
MIDHLSKKATQLHFDTILTRLARMSTPENRLKFLEVDSYEVWPAKNWTPGFIQEFTTRYGYDPKRFLPHSGPKNRACQDFLQRGIPVLKQSLIKPVNGRGKTRKSLI